MGEWSQVEPKVEHSANRNSSRSPPIVLIAIATSSVCVLATMVTICVGMFCYRRRRRNVAETENVKSCPKDTEGTHSVGNEELQNGKEKEENWEVASTSTATPVSDSMSDGCGSSPGVAVDIARCESNAEMPKSSSEED